MSVINNIYTRVFGSKKETKKENSGSLYRNFTNIWRDIYSSIIFSSTSSGEVVTSRTSININAVYVSIKILGETTGSYTFQTIEKKNNVRTPVDTTVSKVFGSMANEKYGITAFNYWNTVHLHLGTTGNHYSIIERDSSKQFTGVIPVDPNKVEVFVNEEIGIYYKIHGYNKTFLSEDIIHFKTMSWDGVVGVSPITEQRELMGLAVKMNKYAGSVYGKKPPGYISTEQRLQNEDVLDIGKAWESQITGDNVGKTPVLPQGMKFNSIMLNPADLEYIKSRSITDENIYAMYRIPGTFAQNYKDATFSNAEHQDLFLSKYTMLPYVRNFEQEIKQKLLPENIHAKFNMNSILRADFKTRSEGFAHMWDRGIISKNEWRSMEDMNPTENGDLYYIPVNFAEENSTNESKKLDNDFKKSQNGEENV